MHETDEPAIEINIIMRFPNGLINNIEQINERISIIPTATCFIIIRTHDYSFSVTSSLIKFTDAHCGSTGNP